MNQQFDLSIKAARVNNGYTQEALAEKLGVATRTYIKWENGEVELKPYVVYSLAYIFGMKSDQIRIPVKH